MVELKDMLQRIEEKKADYVRYSFTQLEYTALMTFFDLAQEFSDIKDFYNLCVAIPKSFFGCDAILYLIHPLSKSFVLSASTRRGRDEASMPAPSHVTQQDRPYFSDKGSLVLTIKGKKYLIDLLPFNAKDDVLGLLEIYPGKSMNAHEELFFEKYANRIGYRIHNKFLAEKNVEHLRFIRGLVADIEHNVIVPNMVYKLFLKRLQGKVKKNQEIERQFAEVCAQGVHDSAHTRHLLDELADVNHGLATELENIEKHYRNMSLFIETLFRKSHFDQGRLTLRTKPCNMNKEVVKPQLERYLEQFKEAGISIDDRLSGIPDEEVVNVVDVGLIAQVYANLFSNALKYTEPVLIFGQEKKYVAYGHELLRDYFGPGRDGVKYNVFSSGSHIPAAERGRLFQEEFRASNAGGKPGTGHGLAFIKNAIMIHGGVVGYEATDYGNNFYFILPRDSR